MVCQAVLIIGLPFIKINGESALRFDVPSLKFHFFGLTLWMDELFLVLAAVIFLSLLFILVTMLFGRIWCGWVCPQTVIDRFTLFIERAKRGSLGRRLIAYPSLALISVFIAANLLWYVVSPYDFLPALLEEGPGDLLWGAWAVLSAVLFINFLFIRQTFCSTVCPYAKLQGTLFDDRTLAVAFDEGRSQECLDCMACVKACPAGIDIRRGPDAACIHCAECIDACAPIMARRDKKSLIGYFFGSPVTGGNSPRDNVVLVALVTILFLLLFLYLLTARSSLDVTVLPNHSFRPRVNERGVVVNSYIISIKNRGREDVELNITAEGQGEELKVTPERTFHVKAGAIEKRKVYVSFMAGSSSESLQSIDISVETQGEERMRVTEQANLLIPGK